MHINWKKVWVILLTMVMGISCMLGQLVPGGNHVYASTSTWEAVGNTGLSVNNGAFWYTKLYVYEGTPYIAYSDVENSKKATVMKYNGSSWETVGNAGFSADAATHLSLYVYDGTPYIAYVDAGNSGMATVMKYNGSSWVTVGSAGFSAGGTDYTSLYVYDGTPYVAYTDGVDSNKATVMKYNGSGWETVGSVGFSGGQALWISLNVYDGTPYVAYSDYGNSQKTTVMKYNGSSWETVGSAGFSAGGGDYISLYVYNGTPYVAYRDQGNSNKATVMKYNGSSWETVGSAGFSAAQAWHTSLNVYDGTPYVAYSDYGNSQKTTVMKYNEISSNWETVGSAGFSADASYYTSLYIYEGTPYVVYQEVGTTRKVIVMKWVTRYTVAYDGNGAVSGSAPNGGSYPYNTGVTVLGNTGSLVNTGYTFGGWNTAADGSGTDYAAGDTYTMGAAGVTLYAKWTANSYSVTYNGNGAASGSVPSGGSYAYNTGVTVLGNTGSLVNVGYTFAGWNTAADGSGTDYAAGDMYTMGMAGVTLYAKWTVGSYTLAYDGNGATSGSAPSGGSYGYNTGVTVLGNTGSLVNTGYNTGVTVLGNTGSLVNTGYTFGGWNTAADGSGTEYVAGDTYTMGVVGVTLYAKWTANSYSVTYNGNGAASGSVPSGGSYAYNTGVTVLGSTGSLVNTGYTFGGWNTAADGSGTDYAAGDMYTMGVAGVTLYAKWTIGSYTLVYDGNGAMSGSVPSGGSYGYNTWVTVLGNTGSLVNTGYTFGGWNTSADGSGTDYTAGDTYTMGVVGVTLYAKWTANSYSVTYNGNGAASGSVPSGGSYAYNTGVTVLGNTGSLVNTGYTLGGWNTVADGSGTDYAAGDTYTMGAAGVTLYAKWTVNSYSVTYNGNGAASGSVPSGGSYAYNTGVTVLGNTGSLVNTGYTFGGWNTAADGSGTDYAAGDMYTMGMAGVTLYAKWTVGSYTLAYGGNGAASGSVPSGGSYVYNTGVRVLGNIGSLVNTGYTFAGWNTATDGSGTDYAAGGTYTMGAAGVTLYAKWTANSYSVTYNGNGAASGSVPSGGSYAYNTGVTVLGNTGSLVNTGYTFAGWNTAADGSGTDYAAGDTYTMGVAGLTLYAKWKKFSSTGSSSSGTTSSSQDETITVNVENGENVKGSIGSTVVITRATDSSGKKKDKATFTAIEVTKTVEQLTASGSHTALIVFPNPKDEVSELVFTLPSESTDRLADGNIRLNIATSHARIEIPAGSMKEMEKSIYFRITPLKDGSEQGAISKRAAQSTAVSAVTGDRDVQVVGVPVVIETNLQDRPVTMELPLAAVSLSKEQLASYLGIYIEHSDKTVELIRGEITYEDATGNPVIRFTVSKFSTFAVVYSSGFSVSKKDTLIKAYITGYADNTFRPDNSMTRAEMTALLARAFSGKEERQISLAYLDVRASYWAAAAIDKATKFGLMSGFTDGTFKPEQTLTRGEMAAIVMRQLTNTASGEGGSFTDTAGHWAEAAIESAKAAGMMSGYADGTFHPNQPITRAETVVIINRLQGRELLINAEPAFTDVFKTYWAYDQIQAASIDHMSGNN